MPAVMVFAIWICLKFVFFKDGEKFSPLQNLVGCVEVHFESLERRGEEFLCVSSDLPMHVSVTHELAVFTVLIIRCSFQ